MLIVQKYGGSSVGTPERLRAVAREVVATRARGCELVVVVSAMGDATDELLALAARVAGGESGARCHPRELDMLLTAGERISMALLAIGIREAGAEAVSFTGSQAAIVTDEAHTDARIREIRAERVREALAAGQIPIVAGFQGVSRAREVTTLGRGGSDTTAVALAVALDADRCEIRTDVPGVYTADPRTVPGARLIDQISHEEMLELATAGARVVHPRAVEIGARFGVDVQVRSALPEDAVGDGTLITHTPARMEDTLVTGIAASPGYAKLVLRGLPGGIQTLAALLSALADAGISVDMITESPDSGGSAQLQFTVEQGALERGRQVASQVAAGLGAGDPEVQGGLSRIALVGSGMTGRPGVYARAFGALCDVVVEVYGISTSSISITLLVAGDDEQRAVEALHGAFFAEIARSTEG